MNHQKFKSIAQELMYTNNNNNFFNPDTEQDIYISYKKVQHLNTTFESYYHINTRIELWRKLYHENIK